MLTSQVVDQVKVVDHKVDKVETKVDGLATIVDSKIAALATKLDDLQDTRVAKVITEQAVMQTNLNLLQKIVYGTIAAVAIQVLGGLSALIIWLIKK